MTFVAASNADDHGVVQQSIWAHYYSGHGSIRRRWQKHDHHYPQYAEPSSHPAAAFGPRGIWIFHSKPLHLTASGLDLLLMGPAADFEEIERPN